MDAGESLSFVFVNHTSKGEASMFELVDNVPQSAVIKVVGVGGGGGNAVRRMIDAGVEGVDFICANTDAQALSDIPSRTVLQLGAGITKVGFITEPSN